MQTRTHHKREDDIEAVLGRFQTWTGSRETSATKDGVREISYEEAVGPSRYRRKKSTEAPLVKSAGAGSPSQPAPVTGAIAVKPAVKAAAPKTRGPKVKASPRAGTKPAVHKKASSREQPFRAVLAQSVSPPVASKSELMNDAGERQVSVSVRMAASEQALIKLRAAAAGLSVSAYLRQCALDVEILRSQVQQFMTASALSRMAELAVPAPAPTILSSRNDGWVARLRRVWDGRGTQLSLKA